MFCCFGGEDSEEDLAVKGGAFPPRRSTKSSIPGAPVPVPVDRRLLMQEARAKRKRDIKILLLGTGESGKSTILKQMKIIHQGGYSEEERCRFKAEIFRNVVEGMQQVLQGMSRLGVRFGDDSSHRAESECHAHFISQLELHYDGLDQLPYEVVMAVKFLWVESGLKYLFDRLIHVSYVIDSAPYFFDEIDRIGSPSFIPTPMDILKARTTTSGVVEMDFTGRFCNIKMVDVGGQRSERKRLWVNCFENVTSVIFCVALSEYDQYLAEDPARNRLLESFQLFQDIINSRWFLHSSIVLFLNKTDIFAKKLQTSPLTSFFDEYTGPNRFEEAAEFIRDKFLSLNTYRLQIYPYLTCATDTNNINMVFQAVEETVLANALRDTGIF